MSYSPIRNLPNLSDYNSEDVLIIFGEVFQRGYITGLIEAAQRRNMKIIYSTVGRRERSGELRALNAEELKDSPSPLINIPLEAGFDLEKSSQGQSPTDQLSSYRMSNWKEAELDWKQLEESKAAGQKRFKTHLNDYVTHLKNEITGSRHLVFAHTMAGGFPRAKIVMPIANRVFKGTEDRFLSSQVFWDSQIGRLCEMSFEEVTANTLSHLIEATQEMRGAKAESGHKVSYLAYGYHGTDVLIEGEYQWQSYSPYLQGWAKIQLENVAKQALKNGINACVFNAPEILTNSSSIFLGVEVALYPLLNALQKEGPDSSTYQSLISACKEQLKDGFTEKDIFKLTHEYLTNDLMRSWPSLEGWPQHNGPDQMRLMRSLSQKLIEMHKDEKSLITEELSEVVFRSCGEIMLNMSSHNFTDGAQWIGHDIVSKQILQLEG